MNPDDRIGAEAALKHPYFAQLPRKLYEIPDGNYLRQKINSVLNEFFVFTETSIFNVEGIFVYPEPINRERYNN